MSALLKMLSDRGTLSVVVTGYKPKEVIHTYNALKYPNCNKEHPMLE